MISPGGEEAFVFDCGGQSLLAILHRPAAARTRAVVVIPGAPQYRTGSHRQFVLLARDLAEAGYAVLRFDYRGMGDSDGAFVGFEDVDLDVGKAIDALYARIGGLSDVVLWGLCDGASASCFYAPGDARVSGIVLINPWVRNQTTEARAYVRHYYLRRLWSWAFWRDLAAGRIDPLASARSLAGTLAATAGSGGGTTGGSSGAGDLREPVPQRVARSLAAFRGRVLVLLSGQDITAREFEDEVLSSKAGGELTGKPGFQVSHLTEANHTYSTRTWRRRVHEATIEWLTEDRDAPG